MRRTHAYPNNRDHPVVWYPYPYTKGDIYILTRTILIYIYLPIHMFTRTMIFIYVLLNVCTFTSTHASRHITLGTHTHQHPSNTLIHTPVKIHPNTPTHRHVQCTSYTPVSITTHRLTPSPTPHTPSHPPHTLYIVYSLWAMFEI